jgi:hypothetical protein
VPKAPHVPVNIADEVICSVGQHLKLPKTRRKPVREMADLLSLTPGIFLHLVLQSTPQWQPINTPSRPLEMPQFSQRS